MFPYRLCKIQNLPLLLALLLLLTCILMPPINVDQPVHDIQVTFDISQSMNVEDVEIGNSVVSRLSLSKAAAQSLLLSLPCGSRVGWGVFSGRRSITLITPLDVCSHYSGLLASLDKIDGRMRWVEASSVGKGLYQSMRAARAIGNNIAIVFVSDGHEAPPLRPGQSGMPKTGELDLDGLVAGVGGDTPTRIPRTDADGKLAGFWQADEVVQMYDMPANQSHEELSRLHGDHLLRLSRQADLSYVELDSVNALAEAVRNAGFENRKSTPLDFRWIPALLALLALIWRFSPRP